MSKRKRNAVSYEEAMEDILKFIDEDDEEGDSDLEELYGDQFVDMNVVRDIEDDLVVAEDNIEDAEEVVTEHKRKLLTYQRLVNSIETALDEHNYELFDIPIEQKTIKGQLPDITSKKKNAKREISFTNQPRVVTGRQSSKDVIKNKPGTSASAKHVDTPKKAFDYYLPLAFMEKIKNYSNERIRITLVACSEILKKSDKYPHMKPIDIIDIQAFIGIMYFRGLYGLNNHHLNILFSEKQGPPVFGATMSRQRFEFISSHICFDDIHTRNERWSHDRFTCMREILEECNKNFSRAVVPADYLTIDETLYAMRNQIAFKQYNPDKPAKYGMLYKSINSARYPYTHHTHVYCGKPEGDPTDFYVSGTINYVKFLVEKLSSFQNLSGRNISMDRLYTSFEIANWLLEKNITMIGTFQANRVGIPPLIKDVNNREILSNEIYWEDDGKTNLSSYVVKTSQGKKNVLMLSTIDPILGVTKDDGKNKPAVYKLYDFTKGGTDIVDQKMGTYTVKSKSRKWTKVTFAYLLDTIRVNSSSLLALNSGKNPKSINSFDFGWELATQLVTPHIERRSRVGLTSTVLRKISTFTGAKEIEHEQQLPHAKQLEKRARCRKCLSECQGQDQKANKDKLKKTTTACQTCGKGYCSKHLIYTCTNCYQ